MTAGLIIAVRWALYLDLGLLFGIPLFALYAFGGDRRGFRYVPVSRIVRWLAPIGLILTALSVTFHASGMVGVSVAHLDIWALKIVLAASTLGTSSLIRAAALLLTLLVAVVFPRSRRVETSFLAMGGAICLATLAWSGNGAAGEAIAGWFQLIGDISHLFAAGAWLGAICAFLILVVGRRTVSDPTRLTLTNRALTNFSATGPVLVGILIVTGLSNSAFLIGAGHVTLLWNSFYGLLLVAKLGLFAAMIAMAAINRYLVAPTLRCALANGGASAALQILRASVVIEGSLALAILGLVAWLGTLDPVLPA